MKKKIDTFKAHAGLFTDRRWNIEKRTVLSSDPPSLSEEK
jgi:hypothetical protein